MKKKLFIFIVIKYNNICNNFLIDNCFQNEMKFH